MQHLILLLALLIGLLPAAAQMPAACSQAVIGVADSWDSSQVTLSLVEKSANGRWVRTLGPIRGRLGRNGLAWGLGLHRNPHNATTKKEGDKRSPAGIFAIGGLYTTTKTLVKHHKNLPELRVGPNDLWVSDVKQPKLYNRHIRLNHPASSPWELKEQMHQTDYSLSIKLLICHNTAETEGRPVVGAGSAIFFHIWRRNGAAPTFGCTSMSEADLRVLIARIDPARHPVYILLPRAEYIALRASWQLP